MRRPWIAASVGLVVLGAALLAAIVLTTPWDPLPAAAGPPAAAGEPAPVVADPAADFTRAEIDRERRFGARLRPLTYASLGTGLAVVALLGLTPLGARLIGTATRRVPAGRLGRVLRVAIGVLIVTAAVRLATLPFAALVHATLVDHGLSTQSWPEWLGDRAKAYGLDTALVMVAALGVFALARRWPRGWWAPAAAGAAGLVVAVSFAYPLVFEPAFNTFTPLPDGPLRTRLLELARADGVPVREVLVADASRRTTTLNAYVSGFGATRRIVVYDTMLRRPADEVRLVVAHELGHADNADVLRGTLVGALGAAAGVCLLYLLVTAPPLVRRAGLDRDGAGPAGPPDPRAVALLVAVFTVLNTLGGPVQNLVSRRVEARADAHALELTRDPATFIRMQRSLAVRNLSDLRPGWLEYVLYASHPSAPERIAMARSWARAHGMPDPVPQRGMLTDDDQDTRPHQ